LSSHCVVYHITELIGLILMDAQSDEHDYETQCLEEAYESDIDQVPLYLSVDHSMKATHCLN
jgi:hypothetical protein